MGTIRTRYECDRRSARRDRRDARATTGRRARATRCERPRATRRLRDGTRAMAAVMRCAMPTRDRAGARRRAVIRARRDGGAAVRAARVAGGARGETARARAGRTRDRGDRGGGRDGGARDGARGAKASGERRGERGIVVLERGDVEGDGNGRGDDDGGGEGDDDVRGDGGGRRGRGRGRGEASARFGGVRRGRRGVCVQRCQRELSVFSAGADAGESVGRYGGGGG